MQVVTDIRWNYDLGAIEVERCCLLTNSDGCVVGLGVPRWEVAVQSAPCRDGPFQPPKQEKPTPKNRIPLPGQMEFQVTED